MADSTKEVVDEYEDDYSLSFIVKSGYSYFSMVNKSTTPSTQSTTHIGASSVENINYMNSQAKFDIGENTEGSNENDQEKLTSFSPGQQNPNSPSKVPSSSFANGYMPMNSSIDLNPNYPSKALSSSFANGYMQVNSPIEQNLNSQSKVSSSSFSNAGYVLTNSATDQNPSPIIIPCDNSQNSTSLINEVGRIRPRNDLEMEGNELKRQKLEEGGSILCPLRVDDDDDDDFGFLIENWSKDLLMVKDRFGFDV